MRPRRDDRRARAADGNLDRGGVSFKCHRHLKLEAQHVCHGRGDYAKVVHHNAPDVDRACMPILTANLLLTTTPLWVAAVVLLVPTTIFAMCGPVIVRRYVPLDRLKSNNEVAGFK